MGRRHGVPSKVVRRGYVGGVAAERYAQAAIRHYCGVEVAAGSALELGQDRDKSLPPVLVARLVELGLDARKARFLGPFREWSRPGSPSSEARH